MCHTVRMKKEIILNQFVVTGIGRCNHILPLSAVDVPSDNWELLTVSVPHSCISRIRLPDCGNNTSFIPLLPNFCSSIPSRLNCHSTKMPPKIQAHYTEDETSPIQYNEEPGWCIPPHLRTTDRDLK